MLAPHPNIPLGSVAFGIVGTAPGSSQTIQRVMPRDQLLKLLDHIRNAASMIDKNVVTVTFDLSGVHIAYDYAAGPKQ